MKSLITAAFVVVLTACSNGYEQLTYPVVPDELKDCKFYSISNSSGGNLRVVRCPNSQTSTTYSTGKTQTTSVVIDGVTYESVK